MFSHRSPQRTAAQPPSDRHPGRQHRPAPRLILALAGVALSALWLPTTVSAQAVGGLELSTTVYVGQDAGVGCPGDEGIVAMADTPATWCFDLHNGTDTNLAGVTIDVAGLDIDQSDLELVGGGSVADALALVAPGADVHLYYESDVTSSLLAVADAGGVPADQAGDPIVDAEPVTATDGAGVALAGLTIDKSVYGGHDAGAGCPGDDRVVGDEGDEITFCFEVANSGDTTLAPVSVDDADLGLTDADMTVLSGDLSSMAPGDVAVLYLESTVEGDLTNTATVEGQAVDEAGDPLVVDGGPVVAEDTALVDEGGPELTLEKTVYRGHDAGAGCPGEDSVDVVHEGSVTYCFSVTNSGDAILAPVEIDDLDLGLTGADMTVLSGDLSSMAPGDTAVLYLEQTVDGDLANTAQVEGTAVDEAGDPIAGVEPVVDDDTAEVREVTAGVSLVTEVLDPYTETYVDADDDEGTAGSNDPSAAILGVGDTADFRFGVANTSDVDLTEVTVEAPQCDEPPTYVDGDEGEPELLEPEEEWHFTCAVAEVEEGFVLEAVAGAKVDGEPDAAAPDGAGKAEFAEVQVADVAIETLVQDPGTGDFGDTAVIEPGADAVFQVLVENTGEVPLGELVVTDEEAPDCDRTVDEVLAPGDSLAVYECTVTEVEGGFVNVSSVSGAPVDDAGDQVADLVIAESSAVVTTAAAAEPELVIDKSLASADPEAQNAVWLITVANDGAAPVTEPIVVVDELPSELELVQTDGEGWVCQASAAEVRCATDADLDPGAAAAPLRLDTLVSAAPGSAVTNVAYVDGADGTAVRDTAVLSVSGSNDDPTPVDYGVTPAPSGSLPRTGAVAVVSLAALGALLVGAGSLLTGASRRR